MQLPTFTAPLLCFPCSARAPSPSLCFSSLTLLLPQHCAVMCTKQACRSAPLVLCCHWWECSCRLTDSVCKCMPGRALDTLGDALHLIGLGIRWFTGCWGRRHTSPHGFTAYKWCKLTKVCKEKLGRREQNALPSGPGWSSFLVLLYTTLTDHCHSLALMMPRQYTTHTQTCHGELARSHKSHHFSMLW